MSKYAAAKYSGGVYCGNGSFDSFDECMEFADDGFCDYVRIVDQETLQRFKVHFDPKED